jgi:hypothetical protein
MIFQFNHLRYEVPEGIDIVVVVDNEHGDFNFVKDGEIIPVLGGVDEEGRKLPTWDEIGIRKMTA